MPAPTGCIVDGPCVVDSEPECGAEDLLAGAEVPLTEDAEYELTGAEVSGLPADELAGAEVSGPLTEDAQDELTGAEVSGLLAEVGAEDDPVDESSEVAVPASLVDSARPLSPGLADLRMSGSCGPGLVETLVPAHRVGGSSGAPDVVPGRGASPAGRTG